MATPTKVEEICGFLEYYSDGSVVRNNNNETNPLGLYWKPTKEENDVIKTIEDHYYKEGLQLRVFKPPKLIEENSVPMPLIVYLRGGGFCVGSSNWLHIEAACVRLAIVLDAAVVCPDHRLAPEHRLPAAVDDVVDAIKWLGLNRQEWKSEDVNLSNVFVVGHSSGGNIAHHLAIRFSGVSSTEIRPITIHGYVLLGPFFGGKDRKVSESVDPEQIKIDALDQVWRLALPLQRSDDGDVRFPTQDEDRDHEYANPLLLSQKLGQIDKPIRVIVGENELLKDRAVEYASMLQQLRKNVRYYVIEGQEHGFFAKEPYSNAANQVLYHLERFIYHGE